MKLKQLASSCLFAQATIDITAALMGCTLAAFTAACWWQRGGRRSDTPAAFEQEDLTMHFVKTASGL